MTRKLRLIPETRVAKYYREIADYCGCSTPDESRIAWQDAEKLASEPSLIDQLNAIAKSPEKITVTFQ